MVIVTVPAAGRPPGEWYEWSSVSHAESAVDGDDGTGDVDGVG